MFDEVNILCKYQEGSRCQSLDIRGGGGKALTMTMTP